MARVLSTSFREHHHDPFYVLLADDIDGWFDPAREPFETIPFRDLSMPNHGAMCFRYTQQPLSYACTPFLIEHLLDRGFDRVLFFKQESLVLGDHRGVVELLDRHPIVVTPHLLAPLAGADAIDRELNILQSGVYNAGLIGVSDTATARRFLAWWQDRVTRHCLHAVASGMHYEQRWLDLVPSYFTGTHVLRDPSFNVAHWNLPERVVVIDGDRVLVDGRPCRLFRFSGYDPDNPIAPTRYSNRLTWDDAGPARALFERCHRALLAAGYAQTRAWPYAYAFFDDGTPIPEFVRRMYVELGDAAGEFGDPRAVAGDRSFFTWLTSPVDDRQPSISQLWRSIHAARSDLCAAFPNPLGADRERFVEWTHVSGEREHVIPPPLRLTGMSGQEPCGTP